ncbi:MAG: hypothetical protein IJG87_04375 [Ruminococcus sp.]|nr:hypothetical protein [Ruminococcus sp.]
MKDYASLRKRNNASRTIAIIMAVLLIIEMCSLTMLFSLVVGYSVDNSGYVISLTEGADKSKLSKIDTAETGFIVPTFVGDPDIYFIEPEDKINEKDFGFSTYDKDQVWGTHTDIEVFHLTYDEGKEEFTVISSDDSNVFAPGTAETYKFSVKNDGTHDLKYLVYLEAWIDAKNDAGEDLWIPLNSRFHNSDGTYFGADGTSDWHDYEYIDKTGEIRPLGKGTSRDYFVDWEWPFERFDGEGLTSNDAYDTMLGNLAADGADLRANIRIKTVAWLEDYWHIYTDVIEGSGTTAEDPDMVEQEEDETSTITATPAEGYEFVEWTFDEDDIYEIVGDGKLTDPTLTIKPGSDIHAHAKFRLKPTEEPPTEEPPTEAPPTEAPPTETPPTEAPPTEAPPTEAPPTEAPPTEEPTTAYWIVDSDVIQGKGTTTPPVSDPVKVEQGSGDTATITATPDEGYEFIGWEIDGDYTLPEGGSLTDPTLVIKPESDIHAHAKFKPVPKYWTVDTDIIEGSGTTTPPVSDPVKVEQGSGDNVTITATPADGYEFIGWEIDGDYTLPEGGSLTDPTLVIKPGSDVHAHAKFKKIPKYWIVDADVIQGDGTVTPPVDNPAKVEQGTDGTATITASPADGYKFIGWEIDGEYTMPEGGSLTDPVLVIKPGSDVHAHAKFEKVEPPTPEYWSVDADVIEGEGTTVPTKENPIKVIKDSDETVKIIATPADGWEFIGWEIDGDYTLPEGGSLTDPTLVIKPGSDVHAHAKFRQKPTEAPTEAPTTVEPTGEPAPSPTSVTPTSAVTPTSPAATTAPVTPQTGDFTQNLLWIILAIAAFVALIVLFIVYRKVKKREKADN